MPETKPAEDRNIFRAILDTIRTHRAPGWVAEPVRKIANRAVALLVTLAGVLVALNYFTDAVPAKYHDQVAAVLATLTALVAFGTKWLSEIARSKVFAPDTVTEMVAHAQTMSMRKIADDAVKNVNAMSFSFVADEAQHPASWLATVPSTAPDIAANPIIPQFVLDQYPPPDPATAYHAPTAE